MVGRAKRKVAELFLLRVFRLDFFEGSSDRIEPEVFFPWLAGEIPDRQFNNRISIPYLVLAGLGVAFVFDAVTLTGDFAFDCVDYDIRIEHVVNHVYRAEVLYTNQHFLFTLLRFTDHKERAGVCSPRIKPVS
jgi:hypothetical protein